MTSDALCMGNWKTPGVNENRNSTIEYTKYLLVLKHTHHYMKYPILAIILLMLPAIGRGQNMKEYREVVSQVVACYNSTDAAGLSALFAPNSRLKERYNRNYLSDLLFDNRAIVSYHYMRQREDGLAIFRIKYAKYKGKYKENYHPRNGYLGIHLDRNKKITYLGLPTSASYNNEPRYLGGNKGYLQYGAARNY